MRPWWASRRRTSRGDLSTTVAICTYNHAVYLPEAIDSVLAQTRSPQTILVVDDGSTDNTAEVLTTYGDLITVQVQAQGGLASARNTALQATTTRFLLFVDADDLLEPTAIETLVGLAARNRDERVALYYGARREFGLRNEVATPGRWDRNRLAHYNYINMSCLLERDVVERVGGFNPDDEGVGCEDWDLWLTLAGQGYRGAHTDAVTLVYRVREGSMTTDLLTRVTELREVMDRRHPWVTTVASHPVTRAGSRIRRVLRSGLRRGTGGAASAQ